MSAAFQLPMLCAAGTLEPIWPKAEGYDAEAGCFASPSIRQNESVAFYRSHTERMLRRYLYASMQIGRSPSILSEPIGRGWASSCRVKTFEDAVIFESVKHRLFMIAAQGEDGRGKRAAAEAIDDVSRLRPPVDIVAEQNGQDLAGRAAEVDFDLAREIVEKIGAAVHVADHVDAHPLRRGRRGRDGGARRPAAI